MRELSLKLQAEKLRKEGYLYSEVAKKLGIAKSTAYVWTRTLDLTEDENQRILKHYSEAQQRKIENLANINKKNRQQRDLQIKSNAHKMMKNTKLTKNHDRLICAIMFWCEGGKNVSGGIKFINSDPRMIQSFLALFRKSFDVDEAKFRALVHLHEYHDKEEQLKYWSELTKIPTSQFHKPYLKIHTGKNKREGYPGCISLRYLDTSLGKLLKMIYIEFSNVT